MDDEFRVQMNSLIYSEQYEDNGNKAVFDIELSCYFPERYLKKGGSVITHG